MTNYISQPIEPFHVMARTVGPDANPPAAPPSNAGGSSWNLLHGEVPGGKEAVAGLAFATAFLLLRGNPAFLSLAVLILYVTVISGLDAARRRIVQAPLGLATLMLIGHCLGSTLTYALTAGRAPVIEATWLPLFLAACVFYMPKLSVCRNILMACPFCY
jgi:hypothetical protein